MQRVFSTLITTLGDDITLLVCYCLGYAMGLFLGSTIEGKLAIGTSNIELIANDESTEKIIAYLKEKNRGYTVFEGRGSIEKMNMIFIVLPRKEASHTIKEIKAICDNKVFVAVGEVSRYSGGYGTVK